MTTLITDLFSGLTSTITALTGGIKEAFLNILYVDPVATEKVISPLAQFFFVFAGVGIGFTIVAMIVSVIRRRG